jgi:hypothetical protein
MQIAIIDLVADILREIRVLNAVDPANAPDLSYVLRKVNRQIDQWNAKRQAIYAVESVTFNLTPGLSPHTIGPSPATVVVSSRPESLEPSGASWTENDIVTPITVRDMTWWAQQGTPAIEMAFPTDVAYNPAWPNGELYFWPVPNAATSVSLQVRVVLAALTETSTLDMPPGYAEALILTVAEGCIDPFGVDVPATLSRRAMEARGIAFGNNIDSPPLETSDYGVPSGGGYFDYLTGRMR